jgi:hypothetical protein
VASIACFGFLQSCILTTWPYHCMLLLSI